MQQSLKIHRFGAIQVCGCHAAVWGRHKACCGRTLLFRRGAQQLAFLGSQRVAKLALFLSMASAGAIVKTVQSVSVFLVCHPLNVEAKKILSVPTYLAIIAHIHPVPPASPYKGKSDEKMRLRCFLCVCGFVPGVETSFFAAAFCFVHVRRRRLPLRGRRQRRRMSVPMYIYRCMSAHEFEHSPAAKALVVPQGAVMSPSHISTPVFTPE